MLETTLKARGKSQMTKHPPPVLCQKTRANLKSKERENSALFFVKGREETKVNKKRKQCTVLCQGMRGEQIVHYSLSRDERRLRSIKRENSALFFVKGRALFFANGQEETEVNKKRKKCTVLCLLCQGTKGD